MPEFPIFVFHFLKVGSAYRRAVIIGLMVCTESICKHKNDLKNFILNVILAVDIHRGCCSSAVPIHEPPLVISATDLNFY